MNRMMLEKMLGVKVLSDYKRLVAYLYLYENDTKQKNAGFAKIECRNGKVRVLINIRGIPQQLNSFKAYFFKRSYGAIKGIYLGDIRVKNGVAELKVITEEKNLSGTNVKFDEVGGIILVSDTKVSFAAQWDDEEIPIRKFSAIQKEDPKPKFASAKEVDSSKDITIKDTTEKKRTPEFHVVKPYEKKNNDNIQKVVPKEQPKEIENKVEEVKEHVEKVPEKISVEQKEPIFESVHKKEQSIEKPTDQDIADALAEKKKNVQIDTESVQAAEAYPNRLNPEEWKVQRKPLQETINRKPQAEEQPIPETESQIEEPVIKKPEIKEPEVKEPEIKEPESKEPQKEEAEIMMESLWGSFLEKYKRVHPFADDESIECIRVEPRDIKYLPKEQWFLSNNSFLLHGYYNYRYLILGREISSNRFMLFVPGVYFNKEKLMAVMFGFMDFKPSRKVEVKTGEFGYWYRLL